MSNTTSPVSPDQTTPYLGEYPGMKVPTWYREEPADPTATITGDFTPTNLLAWVARQRWRIAALGMTMSLVSQGASLIAPYFFRRVIDDGIVPGSMRALWIWVALLLAAHGVHAFTGIQRHRVMTRFRTDIRTVVLRSLQRRIVNVGAPYAQSAGSGDLATMASSDLNRIGMLYTGLIPGGAAAIGLVVGCVVLWQLSPVVAITVAIGSVVGVFVVQPVAKWSVPAEDAYREQQGKYGDQIHDVIAGLRILTGVGGKDRYQSRLHSSSELLRDKGFHTARRSALVNSVSHWVPTALSAAYVWVAGVEAARGHLTIGQFTQTVTTAMVLLMPTYFVMQALRDIPAGWISAKRMAGIFNVSRDVIDHPTVAAPSSPAELVDTAHNVTVRPGRCLGVATSTPTAGAGLLDRLARFAPDADTGSVTWGGVPITDVPLQAVRSRIQVADAHSFIFAGTVRDMLTSGNDHSDEEIMAALAAAQARDIVQALPDRLDSPLSTGAKTLSGGQRQRMRLARALLSNPEVLLLMEPTSALDATTEAAAAASIAAYRCGKTTVIVSTSPLVLAECDDVVLLDSDGTAVGAGSHDELVADTSGLGAQYRAVVLRHDEDGAAL